MKKKILLILAITLLIIISIFFIFQKTKSTFEILEANVNNENDLSIIHNETKLSISENPIIDNTNSYTLKIENINNNEILEPYFDYIIYDSNNTILNTSITRVTSKVPNKSKKNCEKLIDHNIITNFYSELTNSYSNITEFNLYSSINNTYTISYPVHIVIFNLEYKTNSNNIAYNNIAYKFNIKK